MKFINLIILILITCKTFYCIKDNSTDNLSQKSNKSISINEFISYNKYPKKQAYFVNKLNKQKRWELLKQLITNLSCQTGPSEYIKFLKNGKLLIYVERNNTAKFGTWRINDNELLIKLHGNSVLGFKKIAINDYIFETGHINPGEFNEKTSLNIKFKIKYIKEINNNLAIYDNSIIIKYLGHIYPTQEIENYCKKHKCE